MFYQNVQNNFFLFEPKMFEVISTINYTLIQMFAEILRKELSFANDHHTENAFFYNELDVSRE